MCVLHIHRPTHTRTHAALFLQISTTVVIINVDADRIFSLQITCFYLAPAPFVILPRKVGGEVSFVGSHFHGLWFCGACDSGVCVIENSD